LISYMRFVRRGGLRAGPRRKEMVVLSAFGAG